MYEDKNTNLIKFPPVKSRAKSVDKEALAIPTPVYDKLIKEADKLDMLSKYECDFDYTTYKELEERYDDNPIRGGIVKNSPLKLINSHSSCQQCLYALELDTYGRGCVHDCVYCYAKTQLTTHGYWNNPIPVPINLNELRKIFYIVFETDRSSKWRSMLEKQIPIRIGCMSDSFMWMDHKYKITKEVLRLLNYYEYPYTPLTRSDLIARDDYIELLDPKLCNVQFSISSLNDTLTKQLEPGAPNPKRRLRALARLNKAGIWTSVRINPVMPIYPDGYFSDQEFDWQGPVPKFEFSSFDMVKEIAASGTPSIIVGFGRFSSYSLNQIEKACGKNLKVFFDRDKAARKTGDFRYSDNEIRAYYLKYKKLCQKHNIEMTNCYIGYDENQFWDHQDIWSNKKDCCNIKDRVLSFKTDSREIPFETRKKFGKKCSVPVDELSLHKTLSPEVTP